MWLKLHSLTNYRIFWPPERTVVGTISADDGIL